jgi:hypothetical protein
MGSIPGKPVIYRNDHNSIVDSDTGCLTGHIESLENDLSQRPIAQVPMRKAYKCLKGILIRVSGRSDKSASVQGKAVQCVSRVQR